jgi:hypothetical protein
MGYKGISFIILTGILTTISGCGSDDKKSSAQVCCQEQGDASLINMCMCGAEGTTSGNGGSMTITVSGSSCTLKLSGGGTADYTYSGKVVSESECNAH